MEVPSLRPRLNGFRFSTASCWRTAKLAKYEAANAPSSRCRKATRSRVSIFRMAKRLSGRRPDNQGFCGVRDFDEPQVCSPVVYRVAPACVSRMIISSRCSRCAILSGEMPEKSFLLRLAPQSKSSLAISTLPLAAAIMRAVVSPLTTPPQVPSGLLRKRTSHSSAQDILVPVALRKAVVPARRHPPNELDCGNERGATEAPVDP